MKLHRYFSNIGAFCSAALLLVIPGGQLLAQNTTGSSGAGNQSGSSGGGNNSGSSGAGNQSGPSGGVDSVKINNPLSSETTSITDLLSFIINDIVLPIGMTIAVLFLIYAGFLFVTAQGNETKLQKAKSTFLWTVVGAAILLGAWTIAQAIQGTICEITDIPGIC